MARIIRCECGYVARGDTDDEVITADPGTHAHRPSRPPGDGRARGPARLDPGRVAGSPWRPHDDDAPLHDRSADRSATGTTCWSTPGGSGAPRRSGGPVVEVDVSPPPTTRGTSTGRCSGTSTPTSRTPTTARSTPPASSGCSAGRASRPTRPSCPTATPRRSGFWLLQLIRPPGRARSWTAPATTWLAAGRPLAHRRPTPLARPHYLLGQPDDRDPRATRGSVSRADRRPADDDPRRAVRGRVPRRRFWPSGGWSPAGAPGHVPDRRPRRRSTGSRTSAGAFRDTAALRRASSRTVDLAGDSARSSPTARSAAGPRTAWFVLTHLLGRDRRPRLRRIVGRMGTDARRTRRPGLTGPQHQSHHRPTTGGDRHVTTDPEEPERARGGPPLRGRQRPARAGQPRRGPGRPGDLPARLALVDSTSSRSPAPTAARPRTSATSSPAG